MQDSGPEAEEWRTGSCCASNRAGKRQETVRFRSWTGRLGRESRGVAGLLLFASLRSDTKAGDGPGDGEGRRPCRGSAMGIRDER